MNVVTIPKTLVKNDDLIVMPRREYERILDVFKKYGERFERRGMGEGLNGANELSALKQFKKYAEFYEKLDKDLAESTKEVEAGKFCGPFDNAGDLMKSLRAK